MLTFVQEWGPESLLALVVILLLTGGLTSNLSQRRLQRAHDQILKQKDQEKENLGKAYEKRIEDILRVHSEITGDLRAVLSTTQQALGVSVQNVTRLTAIVDEYADLTRVVTPALVATRQVLEGSPDDRTQ